MNDKIKIIIAEDHLLFREAFLSALSKYEFIEIIGVAGNGIEVLDVLKIKEPDILILDIEMPLMNGKATAIEVRKKFPNVKIVILSMHSESFYINEFLKIGVSSYLDKCCSIEKVIDALKHVHKNTNTNMTTGIAIQDPKQVNENNNTISQKPLYTVELEVLKLVCDGKRGKEIADVLKMPVDTVDFHKKNIKKKTNLDSIAELVKYAIINGVISLR